MNKEQIIEAIESMTVLELSELVKALEEKFGVSAAAPVAVAGGAAAAAAPFRTHRRLGIELPYPGTNPCGPCRPDAAGKVRCRICRRSQRKGFVSDL